VYCCSAMRYGFWAMLPRGTFSAHHGWLYPEADSEPSKRRGTTGITGLGEPDDEDTGTGRPAPESDGP
jgi:hypothetical protein